MRRSDKPKPISLNLAQQKRLQEQVQIILEDYRVEKSLAAEGAARVMRNMAIIAKTKSLK